MSTNLARTFLTRGRVRRRLARELIIRDPRGIVEKGFVRIGGIEQWISIRGEDRANPVLLIVHGGPGSIYSIFTPLLRAWERHFTVVQWDQRGAGKTFHRNGKSGSGALSFDRLVSDGIELTEYLRGHLGQERIILVGSSVGSIIGTMMVKERPELFAAYVGTDQNESAAGLRISWQITLDWLRAAGNAKGVKAVQRLGPRLAHLTPKEWTELHQWTIKANPRIPNMITDVLLPAMLTSPEHTLGDLRDMTAGMNFSTQQLFRELMTFDLRRLGMRFDLPFFVFQGDSDALTPTVSARAYFDAVEAPRKAFVLIREAGHLAAFVRPQQFLSELVTHVRPLALAERQAV
ncbi:MAG TPA: alpha/beta hydrolase [Ktedonobacterales bacterium]|nr:alpha/beta hydrolase [Ktedonobacterales bacterium]